MSRATQIAPQESQEQIVWPEYAPSPAHREFIERLRSARIERGLSIADMSDEVGLTFRLANEFENLAAPLPFDYLEVWCEAVGVPFDDYLAIYRAEEREAEKREAKQQAEQNSPCITNTAESGETKAPALSCSSSSFGFLGFLRAALAHIARFFLSRFSTPKKTPE